MPGLTLPPTPHWVPGPTTEEELEYADLAVIDLAKADTLEGRRELAIQARDAISKQGFFYAINHGWTQAQTDRIFDIADVPFAQVSPEEKQRFLGNGDSGVYQGYKLRQYWHLSGGVRDQVEHYAANCDIFGREHPEPLKLFLPEIEAFARHNHFNVLYPILRILSLGLDLPEESFVEKHSFQESSETSARFMKYYPRTDDEELLTQNVWLKGHTDFGSLTILWSQPIAALQILSPEGKWQWIRHIPNALVINAGDALEFLSGGYYRATIHRVVQPPADQRGYTRLGAYYFCQTDSDIKLTSLVSDRSILDRAGVKPRFEESDAPTMEAWRKGRTTAYGRTELKPGKEKGTEEEIINGIVVKHWN